MRRALVVDDSYMMREVLGDILEGEAYTPINARGRVEAMEQFYRYDPDVVLLDIIMDDDHLTGIELLKQIKQQKPHCLVVMVTSIARDTAVIQECVDNGANEYVAKPFSRQQLVTILRSYAQDDSERRVLIVDDSAMMRKVIRDIAEGYVSEIYEAGGKDEALRIHEEAPASLVFLDIIMDNDRFTGVEVLRQFKQDNPSCRVVMVTSLTSQESVIQECVDLGADEYIAKPFKREEVQGALERLL